MTRRTPQLLIGTSGWHYEHWKGPFYPEGLSGEGLLRYAADRFPTVEINNTFHQLPSRGSLAAWRDAVPPGFVFSVKASRYITHTKKLKDPEKTLPPFFDAVKVLKDKLGPVLFQLPPKWRFNPDRLYDFLEALPSGLRYAFEFRDPSWFDPRAIEALTETGAAFCMYELAGTVSPKHVTADFVYVRLHGPDGAYRGRYGRKGLAGWAGALHAWADRGWKIFCYFDNDEAGFAPLDALDLKAMLEKG
jgi:uncharacterized protein YecE (DUF72 family)